ARGGVVRRDDRDPPALSARGAGDVLDIHAALSERLADRGEAAGLILELHQECVHRYASSTVWPVRALRTLRSRAGREVFHCRPEPQITRPRSSPPRSVVPFGAWRSRHRAPASRPSTASSSGTRSMATAGPSCSSTAASGRQGSSVLPSRHWPPAARLWPSTCNRTADRR